MSYEEEANQQLRRQILEIQLNPKLLSNEKAILIQRLMSSNWNSRKDAGEMAPIRNKFDTRDGLDLSQLSLDSKSKNYHSEGILGCEHYRRKCKIQASCCSKWFSCRICHNDVSDHVLMRKETETMICMACDCIQSPSNKCIECKEVMARYFCAECNLWDDDVKKNIYHCKDCGICRVGKGLDIDYFHCKTCSVCMVIGLLGKHKCIQRNLDSNCPICNEDLFTSTSTVIFMPCGHCIHYKCHQQHVQTSFQCPTCFKSLADMSDYFKRIDDALAQHEMPIEYRDTYSHIYCNDCELRSHSKFHFLYHKCTHCRGYNTKLLSTQVGLPSSGTIEATSVTDSCL